MEPRIEHAFQVSQLEINPASDNNQQNLYINLYINPRPNLLPWYHKSQQSSKQLEIQFILDTGADINLINYKTFLEIQKLIPDIQVIKNNTKVIAANNETIDIYGLIKIPVRYSATDKSLDIQHREKEKFTILKIYKPNYEVPNLLGYNFIKEHCKSLNIKENTITTYEIYDDLQTIPLSTKASKNYPYISLLHDAIIQKTIHVPKKHLYVANIKPIRQEVKQKNTVYRINERIKKTNLLNIEVFNPNTLNDKLKIVFENPTQKTISIRDGYIGYLQEDIEQTEQIYKPKHTEEFIRRIQNIENIQETKTEQKYKQNQKDKENEIKKLEIQQQLQEAGKLKQQKIWNINKTSTEIKNINNMYENALTKIYAENIENENWKDERILFSKSESIDSKLAIIQQEFPNYTLEEIQFLSKFNLKTSMINQEEKTKLFDKVIQYIHCYAQHKYDIGKITKPFQIKIKEGTVFKKQRPTKIAIQHRDEVENTLQKMEKEDIVEQMGLDETKHELGSLHFNPMIILKKGQTIKIVLDVRFLNSITDEEFYHWPLESIDVLLTRIHGTYFTTSDMACAYHQVPLTEESQKYCTFSTGNTQWKYKRAFYGLKCLPYFFTRMMMLIFAPMIKTKKMITYIDDVLIQAKTKQEMFDNIDEFHKLLEHSGLKADPLKTNFFQTKINFLGHSLSKDGISPLLKRVEELQKLKPPTNKLELYRYVGCWNFYNKFIRNLNLRFQPMYHLLKDDIKFEWTQQHQNIFDEIKKEISADIKLAIPNSKDAFEIHCDASGHGIGTILIQHRDEGKRIVSMNSRVFQADEQTMAPIHRELAALQFALEKYEYLIIGSKHPLGLFTDHKPILYLFSKKAAINQQFHRFQTTLTKFNNIHVKWKKGSDVPWADLLSRTQTDEEKEIMAKEAKQLPRNIKFFDKDDNEVFYYITYEKEDGDPQDCHTIIKKMKGHTKGTKIKMYNKANFTQTGPEDKELHLPQTLDNIIFLEAGPETKDLNLAENLQQITDIADNFRNPKILKPKKKKNKTERISTINTIENLTGNEKTTQTNEKLPKVYKQTRINKQNEKENYYTTDSKIQTQEIKKRLSQTEIKYVPIKSDEFWKEYTLDPITLKQKQEDDDILKIIRKWLIKRGKNENKHFGKPDFKTADIMAHPALNKYFQIFEQLFIDDETGVICRKDTKRRNTILLPIHLIYSAFYAAHIHTEAGHFGLEKTYQNIRYRFYCPGLLPWIAAFTNDCQELQQKKKIRKQQRIGQ
jgi:hypothetical protein